MQAAETNVKKFEAAVAKFCVQVRAPSFVLDNAADPLYLVMDPDSRIHASVYRIYIWILDLDPAIFVNDKTNFCSMFFCLFLFEGVHLHHKLKRSH